MHLSLTKKFIWVTIFGIAMGLLETAIVVYLRMMYFPDGFDFPLISVDPQIVITELPRELATIIMLIAIGVLVGKNAIERFAWFLYTFAIWDIFYYVFLKVLIDWPESLLTWDVLFLIPMLWVGPVIAPVICSLIMIALTGIILRLSAKLEKVKLHIIDWGLWTTGSLVTIYSFGMDYFRYVDSYYRDASYFILTFDENLARIGGSYVPDRFDWWVFIFGQGLIIGGIITMVLRNKTKN